MPTQGSKHVTKHTAFIKKYPQDVILVYSSLYETEPTKQYQFNLSCLFEVACLISRIMLATCPIYGRSLGSDIEQDSPILTNGMIQLSIRLVASRSACSIVGSTTWQILLGNALATKSCRVVLPLNFPSVGLLPVIISNKSIPKLYTSPLVEISLLMLYSALDLTKL